MTSLVDRLDEHTTLEYKKLEGSLPISLDIYYPPQPYTAPSRVPSDVPLPVIPTVVYFHAGGLTVGNRESWFPNWLHKRVNSLGYVFISADYQLIPPSTAHDIVKDLQDLFAFITGREMQSGEATFKVDCDRIAVCGSSAGGLCAYLAVMNCEPKPKALLSLYGMGGDFFTWHYIAPKTSVFFRGREMLDPANFAKYLYPFQPEDPLHKTSDSPRAYHPQSYHIPNYPANERMLLARLYLQMGNFLDYYTGMHEPSLSALLRDILLAREGEENKEGNARALDSSSSPTSTAEDYKRVIPPTQFSIFPQLADHGSWPPTLLWHGTADTAVPIEDSRNMHKLLENAGVPVQLIEFENQEHSFDYSPNAEDLWKENFDGVKAFFDKWLRN
ncbi:hypothetical protein CVT26_012867 [Gymnopilus dilepis]|uniref:Alpha/beta hydrolase fold-3 domain-containing protein n=1 Tax=Gymnopilus dilepis TaxID=231916 RepID=A0A409YNZ5_9AGAR|nr:hypothetical protein CVT26_012867 [Gymnopilus dilepis]